MQISHFFKGSNGGSSLTEL